MNENDGGDFYMFGCIILIDLLKTSSCYTVTVDRRLAIDKAIVTVDTAALNISADKTSPIIGGDHAFSADFSF